MLLAYIISELAIKDYYEQTGDKESECWSPKANSATIKPHNNKMLSGDWNN